MISADIAGTEIVSVDIAGVEIVSSEIVKALKLSGAEKVRAETIWNRVVIAEDIELKGSGFKTRTCCNLWLARGPLWSLVNPSWVGNPWPGRGP